MRVPGTKIYRAFEELDRFSDEQCERFLAAALRPMRRTLRWVVSGGIGAALVAIGLIASFWIMNQIPLERGEATSLRFWGILLAMAVAMATVAVFAAALVRDALLRRRLQKLIGTGATCRGCRYGLLGLILSAENTVACPECGQINTVNAAFGELTSAAGGRRVFLTEHWADEESYWTPARLKVLKRSLTAAAVLAVVVLVTVGATVLWRFHAASTDAATARSLLDRQKSENDIAARLSAVSFDAMDARTRGAVVRAGLSILETTQSVFDEFLPQATAAIPPLQLYSAGGMFDMMTSAFTPAQVQFNTTVDQALFSRLEAAGFSARAEEFSAAMLGDESVRAALPSSDFPPDDAVYFHLELHRSVNVRRLERAVAAKDAAEGERALRVLVALGRVGNPEYLLVRESAEIQRLDAAQSLLPLADAAMLSRIEALLRNDTRVSRLVGSVEHNRHLLSRYIYTAFADADLTRWGVASLGPQYVGANISLADWYRMPRLGRLAENIAGLELVADDAIRVAGLSPAQRRTIPSTLPGGPPLYLVQFCMPANGFDRAIGVNDRLGLLRHGVATSIAIERYQRATGAYPEQLTDLVPAYLEAVPTDPWSDQPLLYKPSSPAGGTGRGFVLYSVGLNGRDDGGQSTGVVPGSVPVRSADDLVLTESTGWWRRLPW